MTKQTWTAAVSALLFVLSAAIVAVVPVPFVTYAPGATYDLLGAREGVPVVHVEGIVDNATTGQIRLSTVSVSAPEAVVSLPEVLYAHWAAERAAMPRSQMYADGSTPAEIKSREVAQLTTTQADAAAAALRAAGVEVQQVPMVQAVSSTGPAVDKLFPGDFVIEIDQVPTPTLAAFREQIAQRAIGDQVELTVLRDRQPVAVTIKLAASTTRVGAPVWGGTIVMGYSYAPRVVFDLDPAVSGSSGGLMMALAVFDRVNAGDLIDGRTVAGTGTIDGAGNLGPVVGVPEKVAGAARDGAEVFFVPAGNCRDLQNNDFPIRIVSVMTLEGAIAALDALSDPATESLVKGC